MQRKQRPLKQRLLLRSRRQNLMLNNNKTEVIKVQRKMKGEVEAEDEVVVVEEEVDVEEASIVVGAGVVNKIPTMTSK